jgi:Na+/H+ antiporter NhaC
VTPVLITLTLACATAEVSLELGMDRLFADLVNLGDFRVESYPTLGFMVSFVLAMATGSSAAAQAIFLPLSAVPIYVESNGNAKLFYALVGGVMSGSVGGDHSSPLSASSILSSVTIECDLRDHMVTQIPYILFAVLSVLVGHLPSASGNFPWYISYIFGLGLSLLFLYFMCEDRLHPEGKFDFITERFFVKRSPLLKEQQEAILAENDDKKSCDRYRLRFHFGT